MATNPIQVTCRCQARYRAPAQLAGKRVKCRKCGSPIDVPRVEEDELVVDILEEGPAVIDQPRDVIVGGSGPVAAVRPAAVLPAISSGRMSAYWGDCLRSLVFIAEPGAIGTFLALAAMAAVQPFFAFGGCFGVIAKFVVVGWIFSFLFSVVLEAASGERRLPELELLEHPIETIIIPLFKFTATWAVCLAPAIAYTWLVDVDWTAPQNDAALMALVGLGLFMWPMVTLVIALGGVASFARPDLLAGTIAKTIIPYLATCILTAAVFVGCVAAQIGIAMAGISKHPLIILCVLEIVQVYALIVMMRFVGFYFHHFKRSFAWDWG